MRIIQLTDGFGVGGLEAIIRDYVLYFSGNHYCKATILFHTNNDKVFTSELLAANKDITFLEPEYITIKKPIKKVYSIFTRAKKLRSEILTYHINVVHIHHLAYKDIFLSGTLTQDIKLFKTVHNEPRLVFKKKLSKFITKYLIKHHNLRLVALHETMRQELNEMFGVTNTVVIRNGIDMERFNPERYKDSKADFKKSLGFQENDYIVGTIGRLAEQKNQKHLILTFAELLKQKPNAKLLLVGEGELRQDLQQQINHLNLTHKVLMTGIRSDIPELLSIMDVFVFPSIYEGLGIVLAEAQAMGVKCVVSSAVPKEAHLTENYITLELEQTHEEWCNAILDDTIRTTPVDSLENYDMREVVKQLEKLYSQ